MLVVKPEGNKFFVVGKPARRFSGDVEDEACDLIVATFRKKKPISIRDDVQSTVQCMRRKER